MNTRSTWTLVLVAAACFAALWLADGRFRRGAIPTKINHPLFPQLLPSQADAVDVTGTNLLVRARRSNGRWMLATPSYPAQDSPINDLLQATADASELDRISAREVMNQPGGLKAFGLEPPRVEIGVGSGTARYVLRIGAQAPFARQIYVQVAGSADVIVTESSLLASIPAQTSDWRDRSLFAGGFKDFNKLQIKSGARTLEIEQSGTNNLWRLVKPIPGRADSRRIEATLEELQHLRVETFVADAGAVDFERYGLQPPLSSLTLLSDTNLVALIDFGASPTNQPGLVYARIGAFTNVVLVPKATVELLQISYKSWHDPRLLTFPQQSVSRVEISGIENFAVQRQTNGTWIAEGTNSIVCDPFLVGYFLTNLSRLEISDFVREVPSEEDLRNAQLLPPKASIRLLGRATNATGVATNVLISQLNFGASTPDSISVWRTDEAPIYATPVSGLLGIPSHAFQLRDRRPWVFESTNVTSLSVVAAGKTTDLKRNDTGGWGPDTVLNAAFEDLMHRLGHAEILSWMAKGDTGLAAFGFNTTSPSITLNLRTNGVETNLMLIFGRRSPRNNPYAAAFLPGEKDLTVFEFPAALHDQLLRYLPLGG